MAESIQVVPSGAVGKQVYAVTGTQVVVDYIILDAPTSASTVTVRDGNASGDVRMTLSSPVGDSNVAPMCLKRFDKGMHVKVIGVDAKAYFIIK